jgi:hypothetical protein
MAQDSGISIGRVSTAIRMKIASTHTYTPHPEQGVPGLRGGLGNFALYEFTWSL